MDKKNLAKEIGFRLNRIRSSLKYSIKEMAEYLGILRSTYTRYESGETTTNIMTMHRLAESMDISLDWLIRNKGPLNYKEKEVEKEPEPKQRVDTLPADVQDLIKHIERVPILRYEVLLFFHKFKKENKEMIAAAMEKESVLN